MKTMYKNIFSNLSLFALILVICLYMSTSVSFAGEVYTANAHGHYSHPVTGLIEDPGNNPGIGEGMVANVVYGTALIEKDDDGKLYATVRYNLRENISKFTFNVQNKGASGWTEVPYQETQNAGSTGDFRFEVPSANCVVRATFFVGPMSRSVVFYIDFDDLQAGNTDFKALVSTSSSGQTSNTNGANTASASQSVNTPKSGQVNHSSGTNASNDKIKTMMISANKTGAKQAAKTSESVAPKPGGANDKKINQGDLGYDHGLLTNKDFGDSKGLMDGQEEDAPWGIVTKVLFAIIVVLLAIILAIILFGAISLVLAYYHLKKKNDSISDELEKQGFSFDELEDKEILCESSGVTAYE